MLKIRLARVGKKKKPAYRFIVNESARDTYGKALEILGHYNPFSKVIDVKKDRILYWISKGAQLSPTVHNILIDQNVIEGDKVTASKAKKKKKGAEEAPAAESGDKPAEPKADGAPDAEPAEAKSEGDAPAEPAVKDKPVETVPETPTKTSPPEEVREEPKAEAPEAPEEEVKKEETGDKPVEEDKAEDKKE